MIELPAWACVSEKRRAHIERVTALLDRWASDLHVSDAEAREWRDAGLLHDALRDAPEEKLRALVPRPDFITEMLHGPAVAVTLERAGDTRREMLDAIRWHTVGSAEWDVLGRALYMADYLEPGRKFSQGDRAFLAALVTTDFDGVFRQVVRQRIEWSLREGKRLFPETVALWNSLR